MGKRDGDGNYQPISRVAFDARLEREERQPSRPTRDPEPTPPVLTDPGPHEGAEQEWYEEDVENAARASLPSAEDASDYVRLERQGYFTNFAQDVVRSSGIDLALVARELLAIADEVAAKEKQLNTKQVAQRSAPQSVPWEPLPGVSVDDVCISLFDANDLALRGRKAVATRQYHRSVVFYDSFLGEWGGANWLFGQKLEFQQEWRHEGFTLGELVSSMSLLPGEELTIEVSSWQRTKTEIAQEQDETTRRLLESEQRNTDERACTNNVAVENGCSVSATGSVGYPVCSASVTATSTGSTSRRAEESFQSLRDATSKATSEVSSRRAIKLTQTSEAGSETTTTRRLRNPSNCDTVTYNFFQVLKLYDVQIRLIGDSPMLLLPGIWPKYYGRPSERKGQTPNRPTEVLVPYHVIEGWRSPAVFLTRYFEVDRDLCPVINGWALRFRFDPASPEEAIQLLAEGLVVATQYLLKISPGPLEDELGELLRNLVESILTLRRSAAAEYGPGEGRSEQLNTSGIYADSLRGRCSACEDHVQAGHYVDVMQRFEELRRLRSLNRLDETELRRREKRLEQGQLDPFNPAPPDGTQT